MSTGLQSFRNTSRIAGCRECFLSVGLPSTAWEPRPQRFEPKRQTPSTTAQPSVTQVRNTVTQPVHTVSAPSRKRRYGPEPGTLRRYAADDRRLFRELKRIMNRERKSLTAAALDLAQADRIAGVGTAKSRAKRLAGLYQRERGGARQGRGSKSRRRRTSG